MRAAVIGTGGIARNHLSAYQALDDQVEVVAGVDVDAGRLREFCARTDQALAYDDLDRMLAEQRPDLVSICTPPSLHREQTLAALRAGSWVWCEKPPCLSLAEYDEIVGAETEGGPYAAFVFQHRFGSGAEHFRRLLASGELGAALVALCQTTWYRDSDYFTVPWRGKWESEGGGPSMGHGIHQMDLLLDLLGPWEEVQAMAGRLVHDVDTEDVSAALVRFASGAMATVVNSLLSPDEVSRIRLDCTNATVELTHLYGYRNEDWTYTPAPHIDDPARIARWRTPESDTRSSHQAQLRELLASLRAGQRPRCSGADGRRVMELIAALYKAAFTRQSVRAGEIGPGDSYYTAMHGGTPGLLTAPVHPAQQPSVHIGQSGADAPQDKETVHG